MLAWLLLSSSMASSHLPVWIPHPHRSFPHDLKTEVTWNAGTLWLGWGGFVQRNPLFSMTDSFRPEYWRHWLGTLCLFLPGLLLLAFNLFPFLV